MRPAFVFFTLLLATACQRAGQTPLDHLHPCTIAEGPLDAWCGTDRVFEDRVSRSGRSIDLKIVVAPALRRVPKPDPLFIFEGGPGGGAATLASQRIPMFRQYQTDRDIVLIDQRGTGESNPLDCAADASGDDDLGSIDDYPVRRFRTCLEKLQADVRFYTTSVAMDDIDDVRQFLGYSQINLWGGSYGTRAALVYLKQHEASVCSVVLDGVAPPDMRLPLYMARDGQRALDHLLEDCEKDAVGCAKAYPGLRQTVDALWSALAAKPHVAFTHPRTGKPMSLTVSQRLIATIVFQSLYSPEITALLLQLLTVSVMRRVPWQDLGIRFRVTDGDVRLYICTFLQGGADLSRHADAAADASRPGVNHVSAVGAAVDGADPGAWTVRAGCGYPRRQAAGRPVLPARWCIRHRLCARAGQPHRADAPA